MNKSKLGVASLAKADVVLRHCRGLAVRDIANDIAKWRQKLDNNDVVKTGQTLYYIPTAIRYDRSVVTHSRRVRVCAVTSQIPSRVGEIGVLKTLPCPEPSKLVPDGAKPG